MLEKRTSLRHLNYHHLQYFWEVARDGNLTRVARTLRVAPSALSSQIRQLEAQLGEALFLRRNKRLELTEAGRLVEAHAVGIFTRGRELLATLERGRARSEPLRIGAVATLSRNFQDSFLRPVLDAPDVPLRLASGALDDLLARLSRHELDVVLANQTVPGATPEGRLRSRHLARQRVSFVTQRRRRRFRFPQDAERSAFLLPGPNSAIRAAFDALAAKLELRIEVRAEVDDMAMLRLLARDVDAIAVVPPVVVRDELEAKHLVDLGPVPGVREDFYAITSERRFPHPLLKELFARKVGALLGADE